ncbi:MAG: glycosyltransferase family 39 protein [Vicinamibacterales bacterium]
MTDEAGRDQPGGRPFAAALAVVMAAGFLLRVWNLGSGIPFAVGIDEPAIMTTVVRILKSGSFNPHFFEYPTAYIYVQVGAAVVRFIVGAMQHTWKAVEQVGASDFYLWGRFVAAAIGTATIALTYQCARRWGVRVALPAAALLAVMPLHVRESHFVLTDVPMTFAAMLTLLLSLRALEKPSAGAFVLAGAAAGLVAGVKYNGVVAVSMPLAAAAALDGRALPRCGAALLAATACVAAFFVTTPFALLDLPAFLNGFGTQAAAFGPRQPSAEPSWLVYVKHFRLALGWPASLLAIAGLGASLYRVYAGPDRARWSLLLIFPAVYFYLINGWAYMFARYSLPMVPFLCLWAGVGMLAAAEAASRLRFSTAARRAVIAGLAIAVFTPPAVGSVQWVRQFGAETTQALAWKWVTSSVWRDDLILSEASGLDFPAERYRAETIRPVTQRDVAEMEAAGVRWVILSSETWKRVDPAYRAGQNPPAAYHDLMLRAQTRKVIVPSRQNPGPELRILELPRR